MASCDTCGSTILFGGKSEGGYRFCNATCQQKGRVLVAADQVPEDVLSQHVHAVHQGSCPKCKGPGPVDVHTAHSVYSMLIMTSWKSSPQISCRSCGVKSQALATLGSAVLGWWGFPWGLIMTPVQVGKNIVGMASKGDPGTPSPKLRQQVRLLLGARMVSSAGEAPRSR